jgi:OmcA/MtrC family decaheme c-type cytochrome
VRVAAWAQQVVDGGTGQVANASADFVPDRSEPQNLDAVSTLACNQCHDPMSAHGGARREVALCVTCHTPQLVDPDTADPAQPGQMNPLDFPVLVHRLHQGVDLPTIVAARQAKIVGAKYDVVGFRGMDIIFAQTVAAASPDPNTLPDIHGIGFPRDIRDCTVCHQQAPQAATWQTVLSRSICGSCHDATWFEPTPPPALLHAHPGGPMADDRACATCHPQAGGEFDLSVVGAHTVPSQSKQLRGLVLNIISASVPATGNPVVVFSATNADGSPVQPLSSLDVLAAVVSGPTTSYVQQNIVRQDMRASAQPNPDGTWTYTFVPRPANDPWFPMGPVIPAGTTGTFAIGLEGRRAVTLAQGVTFEEADGNPVAYFAVDGSKPVSYTNVVDLKLCDRCHGELRAHGNLRRNPEYCVLCHAADATDWAMRPKGPDRNTNLAATIDKVEERSIRLPSLIHRIHTGDQLTLTKPFVVYGFGGNANRFDDVRYPGDLQRCTRCHLPSQFTIETIPTTALPTRANETGTILHMATPVHPANEPAIPVIQSACLGCHDTAAAKAHAALETAPPGQEACQVCHGDNRQEAVRTVHLAD